MKKFFALVFGVMVVNGVVGQTIASNDIPVPHYNQQQTGCGSNGYTNALCGHTSMAMIFSFYDVKSGYGKQQYLDDIRLWLNLNYGNAHPNTNTCGYSASAYEMGALAKDYGKLSQSESFCASTSLGCIHKSQISYGNLITEINNGNPVAVLVKIGMNSTNGNHWMVLRGIDNDYVWVNDPGKSAGENNRYSKATFLTCWDGVTITTKTSQPINDGLNIHGGSATAPKKLDLWFRLSSLTAGSSFTVQNCILKNANNTYSIAANRIVTTPACAGYGRFTIDLPAMKTANQLNGITNASYDLSFEINNTSNKYLATNQVYFIDPNQLSDISATDLWAKPYIDYGINQGLFRGVPIANGYEFQPNQNVTRGQAARFIFVAANKLKKMEINTTGISLPNISPSHPDYPYMQTLNNYNVLNNGNPDDFVTASQFAKMLCLGLGLNASDENAQTIAGGLGPKRIKTTILSTDPSLQDFLNRLYKIYVMTEVTSGRYQLEPLTTGLLNATPSHLVSASVIANGDNYLTRDLIAKAIVNTYRYVKDKGVNSGCFPSPQLLSIFNNNFSSFTTIGDKFELPSNSSGLFNFSVATQSVNMVSAETKEFGTEVDDFNGFPLAYYWSVDGGTLNPVYSNSNKKVTFVAPTVSSATNVTLYLWIGCGNGLAKEVFYNITVYPQGQQPTTAPTIQAKNIQFTANTTNSISLSWTRGNGQNCIVTCTEMGANAIDAPDPGVVYSGSSNFNNAPVVFGGSDTKVVYTGANSTLTVTGLLTNTQYRFAVYEYNGTSLQNIKYNLSNPAYGVGTTLPPTPPPTPPSAWFMWVNPVVAGQPEAFQNSSSGATSYSWSFQGGNPLTSTATNPTVTFNNPGTYNVTLTAFNSNTGLSDQLTSQVQVLSPSAVLPDLYVVSADVPSSIVINSNATFSHTVSNQGYSYNNLQETNTKYYLSLNNTLEISDYEFGLSTDYVHPNGILPGTSASGTSTLNFSGTIGIVSSNGPGQYYLLIKADGAGYVSESNENNNVLAVPIQLVNGLPDFTITSATINKTTFQTGETAVLNFTGVNNGPASATQWVNYAYYISQDTNTLDNAIWSSNMQLSTPGFPSTKSDNIKVSSFLKSGSYFLVLYLDYQNSVVEGNENNNKKVFVITITNNGQPTTPASNYKIVKLNPTSCQLSWTNGNGQGRVAVVCEEAPNTADDNFNRRTPKDSVVYTANSDFNLGQALNTSGLRSRVVYSGTGNSVNISGLDSTKEYYFNVFEYSNAAGFRNYLQNQAVTDGDGYFKGAFAKVGIDNTYKNGFKRVCREYLSTSSFEQNSVEFLNDTIGWTTNSSNVFNTKDGGETWQFRSLFFDQSTSIDALENNIWVGGANGQVVKSIDGGLSWQKLSINKNHIVNDIEFTSAQIGYIATGFESSNIVGGNVLKTTDGGSNWTTVLSSPKRLFSVDVNGNVIFASGSGGTIMKSNDNGLNWTSNSFSSTGLITSIHNHINKNKVFAQSQGVSNFYTSNNGASTWSSSTTPVTAITESFFLNDSVGWIGGSNGQLTRTRNGGNSYNSYNGLITGFANDIAATSDKTVYVFTTDGVFKSVSGGDSIFIFKPTYTGSLCGNQTLKVNFKTNRAFNSGNIFKVELSDTSGNFTVSNVIGQKQSVNSDSISYTLPSNITSSAKYRVRVVSTNPVYVSEPGNVVSLIPAISPVISTSLQDTIYISDASVSLPQFGSPQGGTFYINNVENNTLNPAQLGLGSKTVKYTVPSGGNYTYTSPHLNVYNGGTTGNFTFAACDTAATFTYTSVVGLEMRVTQLKQDSITFQIRRKDLATFSAAGTIEVRDLTNGVCWSVKTSAGATTISLPAKISNFIGTKYFFGLFRSNNTGNNFHADTVVVSGAVTGGCGGEATKTVTVKPNPYLNIAPISYPTCQGGRFIFRDTATNFKVGNLLNLQLSASGGSFANPITLKQYPASNHYILDTILLPLTITPGTYRIRIVASDPGKADTTASFSVSAQSLGIVSISPADTTICAGKSVKYTANVSGMTGTLTYQWKLNGVNTGTNSNIQTFSSLNDNDNVSYVVSSNAACTQTPLYSNTAIARTIPVLNPAVYIITDSVLCKGQTAYFTAYSSDEGISPVYQWKVNGVSKGSNTTFFAFDSLENGDRVSVQLNVSDVCVSVPSTSDTTIVSVVPSVIPSVTIQKVTQTNCMGQAITFSATANNAGVNPTFQWKRNGQNVGANSPSYTLSSPAMGDSISCILTSNASCVLQPLVSSNKIAIVQFDSLPNATIVRTPSIICQGKQSNYEVQACNGCNYQWSASTFIPIIGSITVPISGNSNKIPTSSVQNGYNVNVTVTNSKGCSASSSVLFPTVSQLPNSSSSVSASICPGGSYQFKGVVLANGGVYYDTLVAANGCDSIVTLNLIVNQASTSIQNITICSGSVYNFNGQNISQPGSYLDTLSNSKGCDSTVTLNLSVGTVAATSINKSICQGQSYSFNGSQLTQTGVYRDTLVTSSGTCDSIVTLNLDIYPAATSSISDVICTGGSYNFNGKILTASGVYKDTLSSVNGCDSIVTLTLNNAATNPPAAILSTPSTNICPGQLVSADVSVQNNSGTVSYQWFLNGSAVFNPSATFATTSLSNNDSLRVVVSTNDGCGNAVVISSNSLIFTVQATLAKPQLLASDSVICPGDSVQLSTVLSSQNYLWSNGAITPATFVKTAGPHSVQVSNTCASATSDPLFVKVSGIQQPSVLQSGNDSLFSSVVAQNYQWYFNNTFVFGATQPSIIATQNGNYVVEVTDSLGCSLRSVDFNFSKTGLNEITDLRLRIYPNPTSAFITIETNRTVDVIEVYDVIGSIVARIQNPVQQQDIDFSLFAAGMYNVTIRKADEMLVKRVVKE